MGIRQRSSTGAFFAQASAGTAKQKEARDKLKKPQAIGGSAGVGTQMVAATTDVQQKAAQNVQATGQQAGKDLNVKQDALGTATTTMIAGQPREQVLAGVTTGGSGSDTISFGEQPTTSAPQSATPPKTSTEQVFVGGIGDSYSLPSTMATITSGEGGDVDAVTASATAVQNQITSITNQLDELNNKIESANAADRKALQDEKTRLEALLKTYQDKLTNENLGQIAESSDFEQQMLEREQLLAEEGGNVGQIAALFGRKAGDIRTGKYGALESQIYGKDLEAIREAARAGLIDLGEAERATDTALEGYTGQIETSKKGYEEKLAKETKKLDLLEATPQELAAYSRKELTDIFGKDIVDKLFTFSGTDDAAKVTNTKVSETRKALEDRQTKLKDELTKVDTEREKAQEITNKKEVVPLVEGLFGTSDPITGASKGGAFYQAVDRLNSMGNQWTNQLEQYNKAERETFFRQHKGWSKDKLRIQAKIDLYNEFKQAFSNLETKLRQAGKDGDKSTLQNAQKQMDELIAEYKRRDQGLERPSKMIHIR